MRSWRASRLRAWPMRTCTRARNLNAAGFWKQLSTIDGKAHLLGEYEALRGGWRNLFEAPERHAAVTRAEISRGGARCC